ncbi:MAG: glycosyltransferase family 1 protein [Gemmatales bacterium]|nr:glycosyltransferase family 1 protein [Gemmatales bacterium]MDW8388347.1 glycosyltransferase family 1 protein [Gemmatales bacterium]
MRICLVTDTWEPEINGVVRTLKNTREILGAWGHDVTVIHPDMFPWVRVPFYPDVRMALTWSDSLAEPLSQADCVHLATEGPLGLAARQWLLRNRRPFTSSYHTDLPAYLWKYLLIPPRFTYRLLRFFHSRSRKVLVSTASLAWRLAKWGFRNLARWGRGVDTKLFRPKDGPRQPRQRPLAIYVGRVAVEKNIEAFLTLDRPVDKLVVGDGPQRPELQRRFPNIPFLGAKHGADLAALYGEADVLVFPSRTDTFGIVMLEALACGTPVAAYPVPGPLDVLGQNREIGALDEDLGKAVDHCLERANRAACRAFALEHSWEKCTEQFLNHLVPASKPRSRLRRFFR